MDSCQIVFLNGTTSSGKTSIAKELQNMSDTPYLHVQLDDFLGMIQERHIDTEEIDGVNVICSRLVRGFHRSILGLADVGNYLIVDHVLQEADWLSDCINLLEHHNVAFVGVECSPKQLEIREKKRGNRPVGLAKLQLMKVHHQRVYDFKVDTTRRSPSVCARQILGFLNSGPKLTAFDFLRDDLLY
jgi:chloramphenicol 3-O phosphotransferase